jgi:hypothetical protein
MAAFFMATNGALDSSGHSLFLHVLASRCRMNPALQQKIPPAALDAAGGG